MAALGFPVPALFALAAALAESCGSLLLAIGLLTRWAALAVSATMTVAIWRHLRAGEGAELPALYLLLAAGIAIAGPGRYSFDAIRSGRK